MSKSNNSMAIPDAIIMTPDDVNDAIASFLEGYDFLVVKGGKQSDADLKAFKNGIELIIESRGNQAYKHKGTDKVFDGSQLDIHLSEHVTQIMRFQQSFSDGKKRIFVMGNPKVTRINDRLTKISTALNKLEVLRFWVDYSEEITIEGTKPLADQFNLLLDCGNSRTSSPLFRGNRAAECS